MPYDFRLEAQRIIDAIEPTRGANMTVICALREAFEAGRVAAQATPERCKTCDGRRWVMGGFVKDLGNGLSSGGSWNEPCPDCALSDTGETPT